MRPIWSAARGLSSFRTPRWRSSAEPGALGAPVDVVVGLEDVGPAAGEAEGREAHRLQRAVAREDHQVGPGDRAAVLLLHRPQQPARLVEVAVVRPAVQGREALHAGGRRRLGRRRRGRSRRSATPSGSRAARSGRSRQATTPARSSAPRRRPWPGRRGRGSGTPRRSRSPRPGGRPRRDVSRRIVRSTWFGHQSRLRRGLFGRPAGAAEAGRPRPPPLATFTSPTTASGLSDTGILPGRSQMASALRTTGALRRETGTIWFVPSSMTRDSSPPRPRSISRTRLRLTT